jgi:hypothetical protein
MELRHRTRAGERPIPDVAPLEEERRPHRLHRVLRALGALAVLAVGAVHLDQYVAVHYHVVPVIGPLFLLNFIGATALGLLLLLPTERLAGRAFVTLLALGAIGLAATSFVFLFVSESTTLFGFHEYGYRAAIVVALAAEAATAVLLGAYLVARPRGV